jgi:hypothetical protein
MDMDAAHSLFSGEYLEKKSALHLHNQVIVILVFVNYKHHVNQNFNSTKHWQFLVHINDKI